MHQLVESIRNVGVLVPAMKWLCEYIHDNGGIKPEQIAALRSRLETEMINQSQIIIILNDNLKDRFPSVKVNLTEKKSKQQI